MTLGRKAPQLAIDTCARRLRSLDGSLAGSFAAAGGGVEHRLTWHGPAHLPAGRPASEATVQALSGLMQVNGRDGARPRRIGLEVASVAAGLLAAQGGIAAALAARRGQPVLAVRTSVLQAALILMSHYFVVATGLGDAVPGPPLPAPGPPFRSAEGRWFEIESLDAEPWKDFWTRLGVAADAELGRAWTMFRWRYERAACSLPAALHQAAARYTVEELARVASAARGSLSVLRSYRDVLAEPGTGVAHPLVRPYGGSAPRPEAAQLRPEAAPRRPVLEEHLPLAGIRLVEATSRIQGPFAGMLLRMLGADVVRVQPPEGDYGRAALCLHRKKQAVQLDLGRPEGRAALVDLVAGADAFLHNWRPGKAAEWNLEFEDLVARRPGLVYANTSGWGDRREAQRLIGTDFLVQAYAAMGDGLHPEDEPAFPSRMILCDLFGGIVAAEGILTGLYRREETGQACEVRSSLLAGAMTVQAHVLDDIAAGKEDGRRDGRPVWGALDRPIPTADGDLMVSADDDERFQRLCELYGVQPGTASRAETERAISVRIREGTAANSEEMLLDAGIPAAVVCEDLADVPADRRLAAMFEPVGIGGLALAPRSPWAFR